MNSNSLRGLLLLPALLLAPASVEAHELKVFVSQLVADVGDSATVYLSWGHRVPVDELVDAASLERYDLLAPSGSSTALEAEGRSMQPNAVRFDTAGVHQVLARRRSGVYTIAHDADGNRLFLRGPKTEAGSDVRIDHGMRSRQTAKAITVVGEPSNKPLTPAGLPIEIVPLDAPSNWTSGAPVRFRVLVDGQPLTRATLLARDLGFAPANAWCYATSTDDDGVATVVPNRSGTWILKVNAKELADEKVRDEYDYESLTTTLVLEVRP